jgi:hypothetical protein
MKTDRVWDQSVVGLRVQILGVGLVGPGLSNWSDGCDLLAEPQAWTFAPTVVPAPLCLAPTERRRAGPVVKIALAVAEQACTMAGVNPRELPSIFTSSTGEPSNCHAMCEALAAPERLVSPTRFTNSVHNAAAGYWHIATQSPTPSTSLAAFDASFAAGLLEAAVQVLDEQGPVLLVAADVPYPEPLHQKRALTDAFGVAFVLGPIPGGSVCIELMTGVSQAVSACDRPEMETLRLGVPAARSLPLLLALAQSQKKTDLVLEAWSGCGLGVRVSA